MNNKKQPKSTYRFKQHNFWDYIIDKNQSLSCKSKSKEITNWFQNNNCYNLLIDCLNWYIEYKHFTFLGYFAFRRGSSTVTQDFIIHHHLIR